MASSGPRVCSSCRKLYGTTGGNAQVGEKSQQEALPSSLGTDTTWAPRLHSLYTSAHLPDTHPALPPA